MGLDDYGDGGGMEGLKAENQRLVDVMNEALDACEDAGRPEGELIARSVKALATERDEARRAAQWLFSNATCDCEHLWHEPNQREHSLHDLCPVERYIRDQWPWLQ